MTVNDVYKSAMQLLGYSFSDNTAAEYPFLKDALAMCNRVLFDLNESECQNLTEEIEASAAILDALPYGVAMFMALYAGEKEKQNILSDIYNAKRKKCKSQIGAVKNVMP